MTRAKDHLHFMVPQRFFTHGQRGTGDRHVYAQRTRFISNAMLAHFKTCSWPAARSTHDPYEHASTKVDIRARMRRMWS
jgi:DNA helicase-2/ATP-dependent DNA helicase PcrA